MIKHASLFTGIGGFDLAAQWMEWQNVFSVEIDPFCDAILKQRFPNTKRYSDVTKFSGKEYAGTIDIISGGFPCQPFSIAGKRKGAEDERAIFPHALRVIREIQPRWVVLENVYGIVNIQDGEYFHQITTLLEDEGYSVQPYIIPASALSAWHRRDRVWFVCRNVAHANGTRTQPNPGTDNEEKGVLRRESQGFVSSGQIEYVANSKSIGQQREPELREENNIVERFIYECERERSDEIRGISERGDGFHSNTYGKRLERGEWELGYPAGYYRGKDERWEQNWYEVAAELCRMADGLPAELDGLKLSASKHRKERIKALGNAIVPQVAYLLFQTINEFMND